MKNAFYFMSKTRSRSWDTYIFVFFGFVQKQLDENALVNFNIYDVTDWTTNNSNTNIAQYLKR